MIQAPYPSASRAPSAGRSISAYKSAEPACPYCCRRLELRPAPLRLLPGFRLEHLHPESSERDSPKFGLCSRCHVVFEDVDALMAVYEQLREQMLFAAQRVRRARARFDGGDGRGAMSELAEAFACLKDQPGVRPFSLARLNEWICETTLSADQRECAAFVLHVADASSRSGQRFDVVAAMESWNPVQRAAFVEWAQAPWWLGV